MFPLVCKFNGGQLRAVEAHEVKDTLVDADGYVLVTLKDGVVCKSAHRVAPTAQASGDTNGNR